MILGRIALTASNPSCRGGGATLLSGRVIARTLMGKSPGPDPLEVLRKESIQRNKCDMGGYRLPGVHWTFCIAMSPPPEIEVTAPNLRTVGIQRVSPGGIDFVTKRGSRIAESLALEQPVAILYSEGKYVPGESAEQWRGEGHCEKLPLMDILHCVPHYTVTGMLVSKRIEEENMDHIEELHDNVSVDRLALLNKSHVTEMTQKARLELENDQVSKKELEATIQAFRFCPDRLERMYGGPDSILWDRWEWMRSSSGDCPEGSIPWNEAENLLPY